MCKLTRRMPAGSLVVVSHYDTRADARRHVAILQMEYAAFGWRTQWNTATLTLTVHSNIGPIIYRIEDSQ